MIDWQEILRKYINVVGANEGVSFIPRDLESAQYYGFTEDEWNALQRVNRNEQEPPTDSV